MVAAEDCTDFVSCIVRHILGEGRGKYSLQIRNGKQTFHYGGIWCKHYGILVLSHRVVPFCFEHSYYTERYFVETDNLTNRITSVRKQIVDYGLSNHAHFGRALYVSFCKHISVLNSQLANIEIFCSDTVHRSRIVVVTGNKLSR